MATSYKLKTLDGTVSAPAYTFEDDGNTGIYRVGADNVGLALGGVKYVDYSTNIASFTTVVGVPEGNTVGWPSIACSSATTVGIDVLSTNSGSVRVINADGTVLTIGSSGAERLVAVNGVYMLEYKQSTMAHTATPLAIPGGTDVDFYQSSGSLYMRTSTATYLVDMTAI